MLQYDFMKRAFISGILLAIALPLIGIIMINRKTSMAGDALSHSSLAGVALGLILGFDPVLGSVLVCIFAALSIEFIRKKLPQYGDMATALIMSTGLGLASVLSDFARGGNAFESYIFGSISSVSQKDVILCTIVSLAVFLFTLIFYYRILSITVDSSSAKVRGINVSFINTMFTILSAVTIGVSCKITGALMVTSLIVLPVSTALVVSESYKLTYIISVLSAVLYMISGIILSYEFGLKPGGAMVLTAIVCITILKIVKTLSLKIYRRLQGI